MSDGTSGDTPAGPPDPATPSPQRSRPVRRHRHDEPLEVRYEFVVLDGPAGEELRRNQAAVMRRVLQWIYEHRQEPHGDRDEPNE